MKHPILVQSDTTNFNATMTLLTVASKLLLLQTEEENGGENLTQKSKKKAWMNTI